MKRKTKTLKKYFSNSKTKTKSKTNIKDEVMRIRKFINILKKRTNKRITKKRK
jgi:sensor histidine kinase YesM